MSKYFSNLWHKKILNPKFARDIALIILGIIFSFLAQNYQFTFNLHISNTWRIFMGLIILLIIVILLFIAMNKMDNLEERKNDAQIKLLMAIAKQVGVPPEEISEIEITNKPKGKKLTNDTTQKK